MKGRKGVADESERDSANQLFTESCLRVMFREILLRLQ